MPSAAAPSPLALLKAHFGFERFLPLQEEIIDNVLAGGDTLALMPTGGGKSLCYQLPALAFGGTTLVVSPLIALMKDQVDALNGNGIAAGYLNSTLSASEAQRVQEQALAGGLRLLYAAPERLALPGFQRFLNQLRPNLIAIDEAHCISEWGHEFRPDYRRLIDLRAAFRDVPVIALTATATERVRADIVEQLGIAHGRVFVSSFNRANLHYAVRPKRDALTELLALLGRHRGRAAIVYCLSRQDTEDVAAALREHGYSALPYHAGLESDVRRSNQEAFVHDRANVIVATIAFGMGIDKPDVRLVVHYSLPKSLEGYYQETGRAGRDGLPSECVLFYSYGDKARQDYFIDRMENPEEQRASRERLGRMVEYAQVPACRRRTLLAYLGEAFPDAPCGGCDVCLDQRGEYDATEVAQKVLSAVIRTGERFGEAHVVGVLVGSREKRILERGHDQLSVFGAARGADRDELREVIAQLRARGLLARGDGEFPTLTVTPEGRAFLQSRTTLSLPLPATADARAGGARRPGAAPVVIEFDEGLFEALRVLRKRLADAQGVPPYVVFGDQSLRHMAATLPRTRDDFADVPGVGEAKLVQYAGEFLPFIARYAENNGLELAPPSATRTLRLPEGPPTARGVATLAETRRLFERGLTLEGIAQERGFVVGTIMGHLEQIDKESGPLDIERMLPEAERLGAIEAAFTASGGVALGPVWELLGEEVSYVELRLARLYLGRRGRLPGVSA